MSKENQGNCVNLICEGTLITGEVTTKGDIRIDGMIKGKIVTSGRLIIGATAKVEGNIDCTNVDVHGVVIGDILASGTASLKSTSKVTGNISYSMLAIEPGCLFNGNSQTLKKETSK